jgi:hypothetical protein
MMQMPSSYTNSEAKTLRCAPLFGYGYYSGPQKWDSKLSYFSHHNGDTEK